MEEDKNNVYPPPKQNTFLPKHFSGEIFFVQMEMQDDEL